MKFKKKKISASKMVLAAILLICLEIIIYAEVAMYKLSDLSALYVLIGVPAAMMGTAWAYFSKTKIENSTGGIVYETAMAELEDAQKRRIVVTNLETGEESVG